MSATGSTGQRGTRAEGLTGVRFGELVADVTGTDDGRRPIVLLHGLTFDRGTWAPVVDALAGRRAVAFDLPGHGGSPPRDSYDPAEVADVLHEAVTAAGVDAPVLVGHSIGAVLATAYAARHPARAVLNIDQPLLPGPFGDLLRSREPVLRGPDHLSVWTELLDGMGLEDLSPPLRALLRSTPRQDLLLGYWREVLEESPEDLRQQRTDELTALRENGTGYHHVSRAPLPPGYVRWLRTVLPSAATTVLPGSGHFPHLARPATLVEILPGWD
ncbi:alpha/beta fold hydrolase [Kineococcus radiotolerans]|uniref:Alpha/beta hydrolase fold n=1 Tax=Kineococcus radiotolerans (strain ATCC BAA-149 / DSM 14245 / SRS30216) TaxID=266940 RepID=A6WBL1_KINRD|nr:alpha/beta hydrolase [Kineococcus radiotolerans]ABS04200.1 alpha/beta hydrolase fold [Kineococcus radiotolerans SRS30216 = ATCC BAA-149]